MFGDLGEDSVELLNNGDLSDEVTIRIVEGADHEPQGRACFDGMVVLEDDRRRVECLHCAVDVIAIHW